MPWGRILSMEVEFSEVAPSWFTLILKFLLFSFCMSCETAAAWKLRWCCVYISPFYSPLLDLEQAAQGENNWISSDSLLTNSLRSETIFQAPHSGFMWVWQFGAGLLISHTHPDFLCGAAKLNAFALHNLLVAPSAPLLIESMAEECSQFWTCSIFQFVRCAVILEKCHVSFLFDWSVCSSWPPVDTAMQL